MGKIIKFKAKIKKLPVREQKDIMDVLMEHPEIVYSVQKSMQLGYSDLPMFLKDKDPELF